MNSSQDVTTFPSEVVPDEVEQTATSFVESLFQGVKKELEVHRRENVATTLITTTCIGH